jgi:hypothetical protein
MRLSKAAQNSFINLNVRAAVLNLEPVARYRDRAPPRRETRGLRRKFERAGLNYPCPAVRAPAISSSTSKSPLPKTLKPTPTAAVVSETAHFISSCLIRLSNSSNEIAPLILSALMKKVGVALTFSTL